jgi:hypothetical protein
VQEIFEEGLLREINRSENTELLARKKQKKMLTSGIGF